MTERRPRQLTAVLGCGQCRSSAFGAWHPRCPRRGRVEMGPSQGAPAAGSNCFPPFSHMSLMSRIRAHSGSSFIRHSLSSA